MNGSFTKQHGQVLLGAIGVFGVDFLSKHVIRQCLAVGESVPVISGVFHLTHTNNTGAAFSVFHQHPQWLLAIATVLLLFFVVSLLSRPALTTKEAWAYSLIIGGGLGNLLDRVTRGAVTDFLDVVWIHYPIFNMADSFIFIGVVVLLWHYAQQRISSQRS